MNIKDILKEENVGRKFRFTIDGKLSNKIATIVFDNKSGRVTYLTYTNKVVDIDRILKQNLVYNYQVKLL